MSVSTAFPTYPLSSLPPIPSTWEDNSLHNDLSPSWSTPSGYIVFVDFPNASDREFEDSKRFTVFASYELDICCDVVLHSDEWEEVLELVGK